MKNILESPEIMGYYAQIDGCYYLIEKAKKEMDKPQSAINKAIDVATGYDKERIGKTRENIIELLEQVIDCKKKIEADYSGDNEFMNALIKLRDNKV